MNLAVQPRMTQLQIDPETLWQAVLKKDGDFDGKFVFAVRSTGIYCKPSCPSRRPRRDRVTFFPAPPAAELAGFRACLRCKPADSQAADPQIVMVRKACRFIEEHSDEPLSLAVLGEHLGYSSFHLQRTFKNITGVSPRQYAEHWRSNRFRSSVRSGDSITAAMYDAGYGSSSRLYERATAEFGMTPATYGRSGRETKISYCIAETPLGYMLVAATDKGICAVRLGDSEAQLEADLKKEFSAAELHKGNRQLDQSVVQIIEHLAGRRPHLDLPLDIQATAFQRQVWEALRSIPYGVTRSYSEIAEEIGRPTAVRAVARACATNPVALVIPCHRVIREDRSLGGYRWGLERKKRLLDNESSKEEAKSPVARSQKLPFESR